MKQPLLQGVCTLEHTLIDTKEQLELNRQKLKELQSVLRDKETEINFLKEVLSTRTRLIFHQVNTITALQEELKELLEKAESPVIVMRSYLPERQEQLSETAI